MNIAMFSTYDVSGGAARACVRLNKGFLLDPEVEVTYFVNRAVEDVETTKVLFSQETTMDELEAVVNATYIHNNRTAHTNTLFSFSYSNRVLPKLDSYDVINLHWIEFFLSLKNLDDLVKLNKPIVWTLHDMKAFTGGCHYSAGCSEYKRECIECEQLLSDEKKLTKTVLEVKKKIFENANITVVAPSQWLANEARKSSLFSTKRVEVIPYGLDSSIFAPSDKDKAKEKLGIDKDTFVLSFGVMDHKEERKGFKELIEAMSLFQKKLGKQKVIALFFGGASVSSFPIPFVNLGRIENDTKLSEIYSAADVFILPSLEDNLPNTILETLSCETPIVAFDTGGAKDIINDDNGKIVPKGDVIALADEIYILLENKQLRQQKGKKGRALMLKKYQLHHQASTYKDLFTELKNESFIRQSKEVNTQEVFDALLGSVYKQQPSKKKFDFNRNYTVLLNQLNTLEGSIVIYGYGNIGKMIHSLISEKIVGYVDINDENNHPSNLKMMKFDTIIISVLGCEKSIEEYLINELNIEKNKICRVEL